MKPDQMPKGLFITRDLPLVAFLKLQNYSLIEINRENGGRASFTLKDDKKRQALMLQFFNKETSVEPLTFLDQIRNLKALINQ